MAEQRRVSARIARWKETANAVRLALHGELSKQAAARGHGKDWVAAYFPEPEKKQQRKEQSEK